MRVYESESVKGVLTFEVSSGVTEIVDLAKADGFVGGVFKVYVPDFDGKGVDNPAEFPLVIERSEDGETFSPNKMEIRYGSINPNAAPGFSANASNVINRYVRFSYAGDQPITVKVFREDVRI